jgi:Cu+-exporting ATPase
MDVLVSLGTNAAYFYSVYTALRATSSKYFTGSDFFETGAMLISFILLGKYLEVLAKGKTCDAIAKLINLQPDFATLLIRDQDGGVLEREISTQLLHRRDTVKVIPSRKFPTDGVVVWGQSHVNESMITGEAIPVFKKIGDSITGGTLNESGALHVECTHVGQETTLAQIIRLVKTAQMAKAPVQKYADQISQYFVPFVSSLCLNVFFPCFACFCLKHVVLYCLSELLSMRVANFVITVEFLKHSGLNVLKSVGVFSSTVCLPLLKRFVFPNSLTGGNGSFDHMAGMVHGWNL